MNTLLVVPNFMNACSRFLELFFSVYLQKYHFILTSYKVSYQLQINQHNGYGIPLVTIFPTVHTCTSVSSKQPKDRTLCVCVHTIFAFKDDCSSVWCCVVTGGSGKSVHRVFQKYLTVINLIILNLFSIILMLHNSMVSENFNIKMLNFTPPCEVGTGVYVILISCVSRPDMALLVAVVIIDHGIPQIIPLRFRESEIKQNCVRSLVRLFFVPLLLPGQMASTAGLLFCCYCFFSVLRDRAKQCVHQAQISRVLCCCCCCWR